MSESGRACKEQILLCRKIQWNTNTPRASYASGLCVLSAVNSTPAKHDMSFQSGGQKQDPNHLKRSFILSDCNMVFSGIIGPSQIFGVLLC